MPSRRRYYYRRPLRPVPYPPHDWIDGLILVMESLIALYLLVEIAFWFWGALASAVYGGIVAVAPWLDSPNLIVYHVVVVITGIWFLSVIAGVIVGVRWVVRWARVQLRRIFHG